MCQLFINADSDLWGNQSKSLRIDGVVTSIRMENFFWSTLAEISARDNMSVNQLITKLYHEAIDAEHDMGNFTSFLRVCCGRYLALVASNDIPKADDIMIRSLPVNEILKKEKSRHSVRRFH
ncbi:ribbon-helix-helix domain-containing protein [Kiloniella antarctica]|uniref:Ribbon-helix-helix domain-containing protein n=1 Tax=Kiloniella antarctica TaxID=1550907 RepID=A0ABW5BS49_9PROT